MTHLLFFTSFTALCCVTYICAQQCEQSMDLARFDCHPDDGASQERCEARKCCWRLPMQQANLTEKHRTSFQDIGVPLCYYPSDFPTYSIVSNETTDFGQRIRIIKLQTTFMPNDILDLTVDLIYETQQRLRIKIYDSANKRYEVPLAVPNVTQKADMTDYDVMVKSNPFAIVVTRKSTGTTL